MPFKWALRRSPLLKRIELHEDIPSICAQKLKYQQVQLALVPVALLAELDHYHIVTNYCIGAVGKVDSVKLYSNVPIEQITQVLLDYQSKSSVTLARILFRFYWNNNVQFEEAVPGFEHKIEDTRAAVVIGDRTFAMNGSYAYEYDLAEEWQRFTGLPFVFAAWVCVEKLPDAFVEAFEAVLRHGVENTGVAITEDYTGTVYSKDEVTTYLTQRIDYRLDGDKRAAVQLFLDYIKRLD